MAWTREEMQIVEQLTRNMQGVTKKLEDIERTPARNLQVDKRAMFGGFQDGRDIGDWRDANERGKYAHLSGAYASAAADMLLAGRQKRITGIGPMLIKMAALRGDKDAMAHARMLPDWSSDYDDDKLEAQYGCTTIAKAKERGVPGWDARTRKVLLNERRKTALSEGSGPLGGYTIPPQWISELQTIAGEDAFFEQRCKQIPMNTREFRLPLLDIMTNYGKGITPYAGGVQFTWQPQDVTINQTNPQWRESTWTAFDLVGVTVSSNQLLADNGIGLDALLTQLFGWGIGFYKQLAFLQGLGASNSMPLGVLNAPATILQSRSTPGAFKLADIASMMSHCQIRSWGSSMWIMHQSVLPQLLQMADAGNRLIFMNPMGNPGVTNQGPVTLPIPMTLLNLPIYWTECVPTLGNTGDVMLVDASRYVVGNRMDMQIDVSPHVLFQQNQLMWRVIARCDGKPWLQSAITDAQGWSVSPMVALKA